MADILLREVTTGKIDGTGVFDTLMRAVDTHLQEEFKQGRIKGTDYGQVYLSSLNSVMQQSVSYVLGKQAADKQAELLNQQKLTEVAQTALVGKQEERVDEEISLLKQKLFTEEAQVKDTVDGAAVAGAIGKQKALQEAQTSGFQRDAEQKAAKLYIDAWAVRYSIDQSVAAAEPVGSTAGLDAIDMKNVLAALKAGVVVP
jgi:vacuolar-type H+-ATPase catalytic subunit A/Vma1